MQYQTYKFLLVLSCIVMLENKALYHDSGRTLRQEVEYRLEHNIELEEYCCGFASPLIAVADSKEYNDLLKRLIDARVNINKISRQYGALHRTCSGHLAAEERNQDGALILLDYGANLNLKGDASYAQTPLINVVDSGDFWFVNLFLLNGADPNLPENLFGNSPLFIAVKNYIAHIKNSVPIDNAHNARKMRKDSRLEIIELLLKRGANPLMKNKHGIDALQLAHKNRCYDLTKLDRDPLLLVQYAKIEELVELLENSVIAEFVKSLEELARNNK